MADLQPLTPNKGRFTDLSDVPADYTGQAGKFPRVKGTEDGLEYAVPSGAGDVAGPASAVDNAVAVFDGTTGKILKDSSKVLPVGAVVGTTDAQELSGKVLGSPKIKDVDATPVGDTQLKTVDGVLNIRNAADSADAQITGAAKSRFADGLGNHTHASVGAEGGQVTHNDLAGISADQHHAQAHALGGPDHSGFLGAGQHGSLTDGDHTGDLSGNARVDIKKAGISQGKRRAVNFIEGSNVTLTVSDDAANEKVDVTITASGVGGTPGDTVVSEISYGQSPAPGTASSYSRSDHSHGTPPAPVTEQEFTASIAHLTTDADTGKAFTISGFITHGYLKKIKVRADFTAGQQTAGSALVNNVSGIAPADTSIIYDTDSPVDPFAAGDYITIDNEIIYVSAVNTSTNTLTVTRGVKGTSAGYHDDNAQIVKLNNGLRLVLYKDSSRKEVEKVLELNNIFTWKGVTDAAISAGDRYFGLTADVKNVDKDDYVYIDDAAPEEALVQNVNHDVASAAYDFTIFVREALAAHAISKDVYKQFIYDIPAPYRSSAGTLYGTLFVDEKTTAAVNAVVVITADRYS